MSSAWLEEVGAHTSAVSLTSGLVLALGAGARLVAWPATLGRLAMSRDCPNMKGCEMYPLFRLAGTLAAWKINYCSADFARCERYKLSLLGRPVPANLMPNGSLLRARKATEQSGGK